MNRIVHEAGASNPSSPILENAHWRLDIHPHTGAIARLDYHISGQPRYLEQVQPLRAALEAFGGREILMNNLSAFRADGSARAIYIYPDAVNGNPMRRWDPLANDQDWALVFLLQAAAVDPDFVRERWT